MNRSFLLIPLIMVYSGCKSQVPETVDHVDLEKYSGLWYEIAAFPARFQKGCKNTTAEYQLSEKGYVVVINRCTREKKKTSVRGKAFVVPNSGNARLKVQFFWPFKGDYWIIDLAEDYSYAVVGGPDRKYLWILARNRTMDEALYQELTQKIEKKGFDVSKLQKTIQQDQ